MSASVGSGGQAGLEFLCSLIENKEREAAIKKAQAEAAKKASQAGGGGGGEGGAGGAEGAQKKEPASAEQQAGARQCAAAGDQQKAQAVGETGCQGQQQPQQQAQKPVRGIDEKPTDPSPDDVVNPSPDAVKKPPVKKNPSPDDVANPSPDAVAALKARGMNAKKVEPNAAPVENSFDGADRAVAAQKKREGDAVQAQVNENHPERAGVEPAKKVEPKADAAPVENSFDGADAAVAAQTKRESDAVQAQINRNHPERVEAAPKKQEAKLTENSFEGADEAIAAQTKRESDAVQAQLNKNHPERAAAETATNAPVENSFEGADEAIAAQKKRESDAVQGQMNANHPERVGDAPAKVEDTPARGLKGKDEARKEALQKLLTEKPELKTNQDLINHFYKEGGGTWEGASTKARESGTTLNDLLKDRKASVSRAEATDPAKADSAKADPVKADPVKADPAKAADADPAVANQKQYKPGSPEQVALFKAAAKAAGLPESWATSKGLQNILARESNGQVGRPNYTYGARAKDPAAWNSIHDELKAGKKTAKSSATGLGQLLLDNVKKHYPSGVKGIGNPMEEAVGMMSYIKERYGNPDNAWAQYGKRHEGY